MYGYSKAKTPSAYLAQVDEKRRPDLRRLHRIIRDEVPELKPAMEFGMLGYGRFEYRYASGREGVWAKLGLANNKQYISLYCCAADQRGYVAERFAKRLPRASVGKSCVRFERLDDLDEAVLRELIRETARLPFGI